MKKSASAPREARRHFHEAREQELIRSGVSRRLALFCHKARSLRFARSPELSGWQTVVKSSSIHAIAHSNGAMHASVSRTRERGLVEEEISVNQAAFSIPSPSPSTTSARSRARSDALLGLNVSSSTRVSNIVSRWTTKYCGLFATKHINRLLI